MEVPKQQSRSVQDNIIYHDILYYSFRHGGDLETRTAVELEMELHREVMRITVTCRHKSGLPDIDFFSKHSLTGDVTFLKKNSPKMFKKLSKIGSSKHLWLTANAQLGTSFFGNLKNPAIFKFQNMGASEHVSTPLVSKHKNHVFPNEEEKKKDSQFGPHGRKGRFAQ